MLRMESANQEIDGRPLPPLGEDARPKYRLGFGKLLILVFLRLRQSTANVCIDLLKVWVEDNLDLYKVGTSLIYSE